MSDMPDGFAEFAETRGVLPDDLRYLWISYENHPTGQEAIRAVRLLEAFAAI